VPVAILAILFAGIVGAFLLQGGAGQKSHSVLLKWEPPRKSAFTVAGYNVYRSPSDGKYDPIAFVTATTYTDHGVSNGKTYYYMVRAADAAGHESPISNQVTVIIR
jgi:fibronectin type 3 domain-containing protein